MVLKGEGRNTTVLLPSQQTPPIRGLSHNTRQVWGKEPGEAFVGPLPIGYRQIQGENIFLPSVKRKANEGSCGGEAHEITGHRNKNSRVYIFSFVLFKEKVVAEIHDDSEDVFIVKSLTFILVFPIHPVPPMASYW